VLYTGEREISIKNRASRPRSITRLTESRGDRNVKPPRSAGDLEGSVADSTDLYAFVSPDAPNTVPSSRTTCLAGRGGPNFYEFGDDVLYEINIDNDNDGEVDITFQFTFSTTIESADVL